jgi:hypothetical protein
MPFTPLHLGAGAVLKAALGPRFSFVVFGGAQVLMDIEPLVRIVRGDTILHGYTHTLAGALAIGAVATLTGKPIGGWFLRALRIAPSSIPWTAAAGGAFLGTLTHLPLDAIMHSDMRPWWPLSADNGLLDALSFDALNLLCVALAALGGLGVWLRRKAYSGASTA